MSDESGDRETVPVLDSEDTTDGEAFTPAPGTVVVQPARYRHHKPQWGLISATIILATLVLGIGAFTIVNLATRVAEANERNADQSEQISSLLDDLHASQENAQGLYDQLLTLPGVEPNGDDPENILPGTTGPVGETGARGSPGDPGSEGPPGPPGPPGPQGPDGVDGAPGGNGADGSNGTDGSSGSAGPQGDPGPAGPRGEPGPAGESAFPFSFTFTTTDSLGQSTTWTCVVQAPTESTCAPAPTDPPEGEPTP